MIGRLLACLFAGVLSYLPVWQMPDVFAWLVVRLCIYR
jgi:hypothetical protein